MSFIVSYGCWLSLTVSTSSSELLHVPHCLLLLLIFSYCLSDPMELLHVSYCRLYSLALSHCLSNAMELLHVSHHLIWLLAVSHCHFQCHGVAYLLRLPPMVGSFL